MTCPICPASPLLGPAIFGFSAPILALALALVTLGLAANVPYLPQAARHVPVAFDSVLSRVHAVAMLGFTAAALWEIVRGWRDDLVELHAALSLARLWTLHA